MSTPTNATPAPRRVRWSVPVADVSVNRWLDLQDSISDSVRLLIRESIQREGYVDVVNKPVDQLPRRGRPPGDASEQGGRSADADSDTEAGQQAGRSSAADGNSAEPAVLTDEPGRVYKLTGPNSVADPGPAVARHPEHVVDEPQPRPQASIDEVMSSTRR